MNFLVIPCFNEAARIDISYWKKIIESSRIEKFKFIFIDDGSNDKTLETLHQLSKYSQVEIIHLKSNVGKANAIRFAFHVTLTSSNIDCDYIGFIDSDSAFDSQEVIDALSSINNSVFDYDAVFFSRIKLSGSEIRRNEMRHVASRIIYTYIARGWHWAPYDTQCGFKIFRNLPFLVDVVSVPFRTRWFFDIEFMSRLAITRGSKLMIKEVPLHFWQERSGSRIKKRQYFSILLEIFFARELVKRISIFK
jgi:glycosyltransferase involved in cell wall biosynthesis